ncbi:pyridoxamine 5'-phosphate oxidase [Catellatospora sp. IY07-71]|uniref:pyridoxamine 5'-phosphate oxidase family protein n=1 Tax=Catellatospora sp. IY07-71 TaxID=2728827 RepID=UPI001BB33753|nr:pyridoxamine 5'-phosphate oxidase family protein [Catellatospora sp. IY07-71]BCJ74437.1 pyridoxamine 5'-phosphate oxidase [Catellatospora sp. IY07-71]
MAGGSPVAVLDARYSSEDAISTPWEQAREQLARAQVYWLSTVRPDGRPHVTPVIAVWADGAVHVCTGPGERKAHNLAENPHCVLTTGSSTLAEGLDLVVEGDAVRVTDEPSLQRLAGIWLAKYGQEWRFTVSDGAFHHAGGTALVFRIEPAKAFGFGKGLHFSQTTYRFDGR